jgi:hypothetical protein
MKASPQATLTAGVVTASLLAGSIISVGFWFALALSSDDVGLFESPLLLSVARQLRFGPGDLYGPFGRRNPLVLIHAPFYYRLTALAAWPLAGAGIDSVAAARLASRALSISSFALTVAVAYRLARLDGTRPRAGLWSALLIMASPVLGGTAFSARPDMLGVAFQTSGVLLVLECLRTSSGGHLKLKLAFALFGLAICTKQHLVIGPLVSLVVLIAACRRGTISRAQVALAPVVTTAVVISVFVIEQKATRGRMATAVLGAAASVSRLHPGGWLHVATVVAAIVGNSAGLIALLGVAVPSAGGGQLIRCDRTGHPARVLAVAAPFLVTALAGLTLIQLFVVRPWLGGILLLIAIAVVLLVIAAASFQRQPSSPQTLDLVLAVYIAGELGLLVLLSRLSEGAWTNYAIQAIVFAAVLTARVLSRTLDESRGPGSALVTILAAFAVPAAVCMDLKAEVTRRLGERAGVARLLHTLGGPPAAYFFPERPALNRMVGHVDLAYDDWLYPVFEASGLAEKRSQWLGKALLDGRVKFIVTTSDFPREPAIEMIPQALGYRAVGRFGPFHAFEIMLPPDGQ